MVSVERPIEGKERQDSHEECRKLSKYPPSSAVADFISVMHIEDPLEGQLVWICQKCQSYALHLTDLHGSAYCPTCLSEILSCRDKDNPLEVLAA
jgi:hypothetical protein